MYNVVNQVTFKFDTIIHPLFDTIIHL